MLDDIGEDHRHHEHHCHPFQDSDECFKESDVCCFLNHREADWDEQCRDKVRKKGVGGHLLKVAAQLLSHDGRGSSTGRNDAGKQSLHQYQFTAFHLVDEDDSHCNDQQDNLEQSHPQVPSRGPYLVKVNFAESDEEDKEHEQRKNGIEERPQKGSHLVESRGVGKNEVGNGTRCNGNRKRPIFNKSNNIHLHRGQRYENILYCQFFFLSLHKFIHYLFLFMNDYIFVTFKLLGSLALLMFGMKLMSETLQKMAGPQLRHVLGAMTTNRFTGMLTGILVTAAVQSSTATTVMTVSFVNAGLLTLAQAISVIMGANIGTTLTAWIMSAGFSFNITDFVYPAFFIAIILIYSKRRKNFGDFLYGIAFMFLGLGTLRQTGIDMNLGENEAILGFFRMFDPNSFLTTITFLLIGGVLTMCVQSSAAVMAITMILCSSGALPIYQGIALVLGENIGTTVTSNLAALTANTQARRAAFAHMFFNLFGVAWILVFFHPFINGVCSLVGINPQAEGFDTSKLSFVLAAFHTCFNLCNTFILIWFIPQIEKIVCYVIKPKATAEGVENLDEPIRLKYIEGGLMPTPEISVLQAQKEITLFAERIQRMYHMVVDLAKQSKPDEKTNADEFVQLFNRIEKYESISDNMEIEIAAYLEKVSDDHLSDETKAKIRAMMREISEIESIGDACYNLARIFKRKFESKDAFTPELEQRVASMMQLTDDSLTQMNATMKNFRSQSNMKRTNEIENDINIMRTELKDHNINDVNEHRYAYSVGTMYMDIINECEKLGDYVVNVVEARLG